MKLGRILLLPWQAVPLVFRWIGGAGYALIAACLLLAAFLPLAHQQRWVQVIGLLAFFLALTGAFFLPAIAAVMRGARQWRLPGVERDATIGACLYAIISVGVPVLVLALLGAPVWFTVLVLPVGLCAGLLYSLGPGWMAVPVVVLWVVYDQSDVSTRINPQAPWQLAVAALVACVAMALVLWAWRRLLVIDNPRRAGGLMVLMLGYAKPSGGGLRPRTTIFGDIQAWVARLLRLDTHADLRGTGPRDPVRSLRVGLGGLVMARGRFGRFAKALPVIALVMAGAAVLLGIWFFSPPGQQHAAPWQIGVMAIDILGVFGSMMLVTTQLTWLRQRWRKTNAELPLLALLPGLGGPAEQRVALLRAVFGLPLTSLVLLFIGTSAITIAADLGAQVWVLLCVAQWGFTSMLVAFDLNVLGGGTLTEAKLVAVYLCALFVAVASMMALTVWHSPLVFDWVLDAVWLVLGAVIFVIGWRGWGNFQRRPHPFLANAA